MENVGEKIKTALLMCIVLSPKSGALFFFFLAEQIFINKKVSHIFLDRCLILFSVCVYGCILPVITCMQLACFPSCFLNTVLGDYFPV